MQPFVRQEWELFGDRSGFRILVQAGWNGNPERNDLLYVEFKQGLGHYAPPYGIGPGG